MKYINIDLNSDTPPKCQCGAYLSYDDQTNSLFCTGTNCIKKRLKSVLCTLSAIDTLTLQRGENFELVDLAKKNYDLLEQFVETCNIQHGIEIITKGLDLTVLGDLGQRLGKIIDTFEFKLSDLSSLCGSQLLSQLNIDFSTLPMGDKKQTIAKINEQLGIDGSIMLATLINEEFEQRFNDVLLLTDYITLYRPSRRKRSTTQIILNIPEDFSYNNELEKEELVEEIKTEENVSSTSTPTDSTDDMNNVALEELFEW